MFNNWDSDSFSMDVFKASATSQAASKPNGPYSDVFTLVLFANSSYALENC